MDAFRVSLLAITLAGALSPAFLTAQRPFSAWPVGDTIEVHVPVGDVVVRQAGGEDDEARVDVRARGSWLNRLKVDVLNLQRGSVGAAVVRLPMGKIRLEGLVQEHPLPVSSRGFFDGSEPAADSLLLSPTEGRNVSADVEVVLPPGVTARIVWAAGRVTVEGREAARNAAGAPSLLVVQSTAEGLRVLPDQ